MARIAPVDPAFATGKARDLFDGPLAGKHFNMFRSMANSPAALQMYVHMSGTLSHGVLDAREREVIQLAIGQANACDYCLAAHTVIGKSQGLTEQQTLEARRVSLSDARLNALARFAVALHEKRGHVSDEDLAAVRAAGYGDAAIAEAVAGYALAIYTNYFNHVAQPAVDFPAAPKL